MNDKKIVTDPNYVTEEGVYFYSPRYYVFDNFSAYAVTIWGIEFPTSEHAFQWKKFSISHPDIAARVLEAKSPYAAKKITDANSDKVQESWREEKVVVMEEILREKIKQHENVYNKLKETGDKAIYENSSVDYFWGIGEDATGQNILGKIWMKLRDELQ